jgi:hypothetical protein
MHSRGFTVAAIVLSCGQGVAFGQAEDSTDAPGCWNRASGCPVLIKVYGTPEAPEPFRNLCPSVAVASGTADPNEMNEMIFAWASATLQFHQGLDFAGTVILPSPQQNTLASQVYVKRYYANNPGCPQEVNQSEPSGIVQYTGAAAWGHQYPSAAAGRFGTLPTDPPHDEGDPNAYYPEVVNSSNVAITFGSDYSGFSVIAPCADSRVIYVSNAGDNTNPGYSPFRPKKTIEAGLALLRDGHPDHLLLKRGETFSTATINWHLSGRSDDEPMVLGAYGQGTRPVIDLQEPPPPGNVDGLKLIDTSGSVSVSHLRILGVKLTCSAFGGASYGPSGLFVLSDGLDIRVEDCYFEKFGEGFLLQNDPNGSGSRAQDICRRNIFWSITRGDPGNGGACFYQGSQASHLYDRSIVEECLFGLDPTYFASGHYTSEGIYNSFPCTINQVARDCVAYGTGFAGITLRGGGLTERNVAIRNALGLASGNCREGHNPPSVAAIAMLRQNLVTESIDHQDQNTAGFGIVINPHSVATMTDNVVCNGTGGHQHVAYLAKECDLVLGQPPQVGVTTWNAASNIAYKWENPDWTEGTLEWKGNWRTGLSLAFDANECFQTGDSWLVRSKNFGPALFDGSVSFTAAGGPHQYFSGRPTTGWFTYGVPDDGSPNPPDVFVNLTQQQWTSGDASANPPFGPIDPNASYLTGNPYTQYDPFDRSAGRYMNSLPLNPGSGTAGFIEALRSRGWGQWDHRLTAGAFNNYMRARFDRDPVKYRILPDIEPPAPDCAKLGANMRKVFSMSAPTPVPKVADTDTSGCGEGRASIAYSNTYFLRVGASPSVSSSLTDEDLSHLWTAPRDHVWYASNFTSPTIIKTLDPGVHATTPCVSAGLGNRFVAVWLEYNTTTGLSTLYASRFTPAVGFSNPVALHATLTNLTVLQHEYRHGDGAWPRIAHGAAEWVVPPSVACFDDGSFAVSYTSGSHRYVALFTNGFFTGSGPALTGSVDLDPNLSGFYRFNHCVAVKGPSVSNCSSRVAFVGIHHPTGGPWAPYYKIILPCTPNANDCWHLIPLHSDHQTDVCLGPAFAHPVAYRPDGNLVVTWFRQTLSGSTPVGTALGFSVVTNPTYAPADIDGDNAVTGADVLMFSNLFSAGDPRADWNADHQSTVQDPVAFQESFMQGSQP